MTREEAIEILRREFPDFKGKDKDIARVFPEVVIALDMAIKALEQRWIPVSERLPETNDDVLVYDRVDMYVAWYSREGMRHEWNSSDNKFDIYTPIIAWMPLPKPYSCLDFDFDKVKETLKKDNLGDLIVDHVKDIKGEADGK